MARKLTGQTQEAASGMPEGSIATVAKESEKGVKKWLPFTGNKDCLPPAKYSEKIREFKLQDGSKISRRETIFVGKGEPRYSVSPAGEVLEWYRKRGGVGRRMIRQFKKIYQETPEGKARQLADKQFRKMLRENGIPGA